MANAYNNLILESLYKRNLQDYDNLNKNPEGKYTFGILDCH